MFSQLLDGVASVKQFSLLAVDVANVRGAAGSGHETGVIREHVDFAEKSSNIEEIGAKTAPEDGQFHFLFSYFEDCLLRKGGWLLRCDDLEDL